MKKHHSLMTETPRCSAESMLKMLPRKVKRQYELLLTDTIKNS